MANYVAKKRISKKRKSILDKIELGKLYSISGAFELLKELPQAKFKEGESADISVNLGIDPRKSDQVVRGAAMLPNGSGKKIRVAVFTQGANVQIAKDAGADVVGMADLADDIKAGNMDFDVVIASPDAMGIVGRLGPVLGPRGLMPNPKVGTVTPEIGSAVKNAKSGQVRYRADKGGIVHCSIGKISFETKSLVENAKAVLEDLRKSKPSTSKGVYLKKITVSTTMGPGLKVDLASLSA